MSNKLEKKVRDPSLTHARRNGFVMSTDDMGGPLTIDVPVGVHKRMHFGHGAARAWPDDLFLFADGHHWWVEFKGEDKEPTPLQLHVHGNMRVMRADVSAIDTLDEFVVEFNKRMKLHGQ